VEAGFSKRVEAVGDSSIITNEDSENMDHTDQEQIENIVSKETYTQQEKQFILERLNRERLERQKFQQEMMASKNSYTDKEKEHILSELNEKRIQEQHKKEMSRIRFLNKKTYVFGNKTFYKLKDMEREYFIEVSVCRNFTSRPSIVPIYYRTFGELKKRDVLLKIEPYSDKIFISKNAIRVYFKSFSLEDSDDTAVK